MSGEQPLGEIAAAMRDQLLDTADAGNAVEIANGIVNRVTDLLNNAGINVADHLLARALIARGILSIGAHWWSKDISKAKAPVPEAWAALLSIVTDLPVRIEGDSHIVKERGNAA